jgi:hypothetical protein
MAPAGTARIREAVVDQKATDCQAFSTAASLAGMRGGGGDGEEEEEEEGEKPAVAKERPVQRTVEDWGLGERRRRERRSEFLFFSFPTSTLSSLSFSLSLSLSLASSVSLSPNRSLELQNPLSSDNSPVAITAP